MSESFAPITQALRSASWSVEHQAVRIFRLDDPIKVRRAIRAYKQAADKLLAVAQAEREARIATQTAVRPLNTTREVGQGDMSRRQIDQPAGRPKTGVVRAVD